MSYGKNREIVYDRHTTATQSAETAEESQKPTQSGTSDNSRMISPAQSDDKIKVLSTEKQALVKKVLNLRSGNKRLVQLLRQPRL